MGTGRSVVQPPLAIRAYLKKIGIQLDVMDTASAFMLLACLLNGHSHA